MFYANELFNVKGELSKIWIAAHWRDSAKLRKSDVEKTNISNAVKTILSHEKKCALRIISQLLFGLTRIHLRQVELLYFSSTSAANFLHPPESEHRYANKTKRRSSNDKGHFIAKRLAIKNLKSPHSSDEDEIILRSSQQKMGKTEDISLPRETLLSSLNSQNDPLTVLDVSKDILPQETLNFEDNALDSSVEVPRSATQQRLSADSDSLLNEVMLDSNPLEEETIEKSTINRKRKNFIRIDRPTKIPRIQNTAHLILDEEKENQTPFQYDLRRPFLLPSHAFLNGEPKKNPSENKETNGNRFDDLIPSMGFDSDMAPGADAFTVNSQVDNSVPFEFDSSEKSCLDSEDWKDRTTQQNVEKKSQKVLELLDKKGAKKEELPFERIAKGVTRKTAAKMFYELLSLQSNSLISVRQEEMLGRIVVKLI